jgi:hypothetical protein
MKTHHLSNSRSRHQAIIVLLGCCFAVSQAQAQPQNGSNSVESTDYVCVQRGPYARVWQRSLFLTNDSGDVTTNSLSYTELGTGICYLSNSVWLDSVEQIEPVPGGAQATQGRHQVQWAAKAGNSGGVTTTIITPDGKQLSSSVFGLAYYDLATGSNAAIAGLTNCTGAIIQPNQVLYASPFSNLNADVLYTYTKAGLSQDIVLHANLPPPDAYGLSDATSVLQCYTQFFTNPEPQITAVTNGDVEDAQVIDFGDMKMGVGDTLFLNAQGESITAGTVTKQWVRVNNSTYLIEAISYQTISNQLQQLPHASNLTPSRGSIRRLAFQEPPPTRPSAFAKDRTPMKLAQAGPAKPRLKIDYELLSNSTNLTLQGDSTYFVSSLVNITGTLTIEGGTVVKYTNTAAGQIKSTNIICLTGPYSPGVLTSMNDNTVGAPISGSTGSPSQGLASYIQFGTQLASAPVLSNLRFSYAAAGIYLSFTSSSAAESIEFWDCQFNQCGTAVDVSYTTTNSLPFLIYFYNDLFCQCASAVNGLLDDGTFAIIAVNITADKMATFMDISTVSPASVSLAVTNSLLTSVTNISDATLSSARFTCCYTNASSSAGIYQTAGAGSYYLANGSSYRNAGSTSINAFLLTNLQTLTTYPPVVLPSGWCTNNTTLFPQAQRDTDTPDLGYHYDPIDFAVDFAISNATLTVLPGTALAGYGSQYGVYLFTNGTFNCQGTATSPNCFVRYNAVQEQSNTNWESSSWVALMVGPALPDASLANFFFTDWSVLANEALYFSYLNDSPLSLQDCQLYNGDLTMEGTFFSSTNCLYRRAYLYLYNHTTGSGGPSTNQLYNNLFWRGIITSEAHTSPNVWTFRDNLFDQCTNTVTSLATDVISNNAYVTTNYGVMANGSNNVTLTASPAYQTGALGIYYYPTNQTTLIHEGSQTAPLAGLYHYTVTTNNTIEGTNTVSIGFHYVAVGANGLPLDTNGDGIPDYLEDANGNGLVDSGEIDWQLAGDLGLSVLITQPANNSTIP